MKQPVIVCIDDEQTILESLKIELKNSFSGRYLIETAESGAETLELFEELLAEKYEIPLVICDYIMPSIKGDELLKQIHQLSPQTIKIMLTGQSDIEAIANAIKHAKLYRYITKPWDTEDLILTVSEAIKSYSRDKQLLEKQKQLERKVQTFHKFVPVQFLKLLNLQEYDDIQLGYCVEQDMAILFSDIRGFTTLSEKMTPQENFNFINSYLSQMEPIIDQYHGFIDKYIGDAIMALFPNKADDAIQGAIAMFKRLVQYNEGRKKAGYRPIQIGTGLHFGPLMLGTVGGQNRMDGTVISDAVNLASRVEGLTKTYGTPLLITEQLYQQITISQYQIRLIDRVTVKGKTEAVTVYEVFDANSSSQIELKLNTLSDFEQGFNCFHHEAFEEARFYFEKVLQINENDEAAQVYFNHCQTILTMKMPTSPRVLIVDDTLFNVRVLAYFLQKHHFEVLIAQTGEGALEIAKQTFPNLILLDVMMPGIDGFETCQQLKTDPLTQDIPIIFMTALTEIVDKVKGFEMGAVDYITKPFQHEEVLARIKTQLHLSHLQKQLQAKNYELEINNLELKSKINSLMLQS